MFRFARRLLSPDRMRSSKSCPVQHLTPNAARHESGDLPCSVAARSRRRKRARRRVSQEKLRDTVAGGLEEGSRSSGVLCSWLGVGVGSEKAAKAWRWSGALARGITLFCLHIFVINKIDLNREVSYNHSHGERKTAHVHRPPNADWARRAEARSRKARSHDSELRRNDPIP